MFVYYEEGDPTQVVAPDVFVVNQDYLGGGALSLGLSVPIGFIIYVIAILVLRVIRKEDLVILDNVQDSLPVRVKKYYAIVIGLLRKMV